MLTDLGAAALRLLPPETAHKATLRLLESMAPLLPAAGADESPGLGSPEPADVVPLQALKASAATATTATTARAARRRTCITELLLDGGLTRFPGATLHGISA